MVFDTALKYPLRDFRFMSAKRPPFIAYVTTFEPQDIHAWSGLIYHIKRALSKAGAEVESISNLKKGSFLRCATKKLVYQYYKKKDYHRDREPSLQRGYARQIKRRLRVEHEVIFSPGTLAVGALQHERPIAIWTDATFANLVATYPEYQNLCAETLRNGHETERQFLSRVSVAIYSSQWAAQSAIQDYGADPARVKVVPFGANLPSERSEEDVLANTAKKSNEVCRLLFIGTDWARKGGEVAVAVAETLLKRGIEVELNIVGAAPPQKLPSYAISHGYLSKAHPDHYKTLDGLMSSCHFFILPSRSECFGVVFAEAASYGLPSIATKVGGISDAVAHGESGFLFEPDANPEDYCEVIERYFQDPKAYLELSASSHAVYRKKLNWKVAGQAALAHISDAIAAPRSSDSGEAS